MYSQPIGVSVLTNGNRLGELQMCLGSFLTHCHYRPIIFGIFNNGSTDDTAKWMDNWKDSPDNPWKYGVTFRMLSVEEDMGCAAGTNAACGMVKDCEFAIHLESDFEHLAPEETGEDRLWLRRAVEFMQSVNGNFLYLRRMTSETEMMMHWWSQWMPRIVEQKGRYLSCPDFWWSNNPALRRNKALYENGTLPLNVAKDGSKGQPGWSVPELEAKAPGRAWIHQWGLFVHERQQLEKGIIFQPRGCGAVSGLGASSCKYGFLTKDGTGRFCECCDRKAGFQDMPEHEKRFRS